MLKLIAGAIIGGVLTAMALLLFQDSEPAQPGYRQHQPDATHPDPERVTPRALPPITETDGEDAFESTDAPFPEGVAILSIGDRYRLGDDRISRAADDDAIDIEVLDIRHYVSLRCPHGAEDARVPALIQGELPDTRAAYRSLASAPEAFGPRNMLLTEKLESNRSGIALVKAHDGTTYKMMLEQLHGDPHALARRIRLCYAPVPAQAGGGVLSIPGAVLAVPMDAADEAALAEIVERARRYPGSGYAGLFPRKFMQVDRLPGKNSDRRR